MPDLHESNQLFIDAWSQFVKRFPTGDVSATDGVVTTMGNVILPFLNVGHLERPAEDFDALRSQVRAGAAALRAGGNPWMFSLCGDWLPSEWERVAEQEGLVTGMVLTGMATDTLDPPRRPLPQLDIRRIDGLQAARDLAILHAQAYELPMEMVECMCNMYMWDEDSYGYVAYLDGEPVSCSATFAVGGTVYVGFVATNPQHQRRGYAEAVMRHSIEQGMQATGLTRTTLHASEAGRALYEAMGYRGSDPFYVLVEPHE